MADLARLAGRDFLVIGRAGMDLYADPPGTPLEEATAFTTALGGSSANIAAGLCRQGCRAALVTRLPDDAAGRFCRNQLAAYGIDAQFVTTAEAPARASLALVDTRGDATQAVLYRNGAADLAMTTQDVAHLPYARFAGLVTTGTVLAAEPARAAAFAAFDAARAAGVPLIFDVDYRAYTWASAAEAAEIYSRAAALCDIIIGNDEEFAFMAGAGNDGLAKARALVAEGAQIVVYKMGAKGAITITPAGETRTGIYAVAALKPTGAGDAFMAGFLSALAHARPLAEAVARGSATAAIVVSRVGCAPAMPTTPELDSFIAQHTMRPPQED